MIIDEAEAQVTDKRCAGTMAEPPFSHHHVATARIHTPLPWGHLVDPLGLVAERTGTVAGRPCLRPRRYTAEAPPTRSSHEGLQTAHVTLPGAPAVPGLVFTLEESWSPENKTLSYLHSW